MNKNTETPNITTKINSKADFTFGKDDILLILIEKKEQELLATLEALKKGTRCRGFYLKYKTVD